MSQYPKVFVNKNAGEKGVLHIVYSNRVEDWLFSHSESKKEIDEEAGEDVSFKYEDIYGKGWNPQQEIEMLKDNGFKEVKLG